MVCLHCGDVYSFKRQGYCEDCYQKLVAENLKLQVRIKELESKLGKQHEPKHMKDEDLEENLFLKQFRGHITEIDCNIKEGEE